MNLIFGMKVIYLMRLDSLVKIVVERCTRNTTKVPTVWNINYQIIKNNNTTTQKRHRGVFPRCFSYLNRHFLFDLITLTCYYNYTKRDILSKTKKQKRVCHSFREILQKDFPVNSFSVKLLMQNLRWFGICVLDNFLSHENLIHSKINKQ